MRVVQILLMVLAFAAAGPQTASNDYAMFKALLHSDKPNYNVLQEVYNNQNLPNLEEYLRHPFNSDPKKFEIDQTGSHYQDSIHIDENVPRITDNVMFEEPVDLGTYGQLEYRKHIPNGEEKLMRSLLRDDNEPKPIIRLNIPGYTVIDINGQPRLVKQSDLLRDNSYEVNPETIGQTIKEDSTEDDSNKPENQAQKLGSLGLYVKHGFNIPRLDNGNINWATVEKNLEAINTNKGNGNSNSQEEKSTPSSSTNQKLLRWIQTVKDSASKIPASITRNQDKSNVMKILLRKLRPESAESLESEEEQNDVISPNLSHRIDLLKNYLKSGGSIPFVATSKTIWDGLLNALKQHAQMTTTENPINENSEDYGMQEEMALLKQYQQLGKPEPRSSNGNINWVTIINALNEEYVKEQEPHIERPVAHNVQKNITINYESLDMKDLLQMFQDLSKAGLSRDDVIKYLREKQKDIESLGDKPRSTESVVTKYVKHNSNKYVDDTEQDYPAWDLNDQVTFKLGDDFKIGDQREDVELKTGHLPTRNYYSSAGSNLRRFY